MCCAETHSSAKSWSGGSGNAVALAILYMEVCARMGLAMAARLLDGGRYVVLWPTDAPLRTCGQQFCGGCLQPGRAVPARRGKACMAVADMESSDATELE